MIGAALALTNEEVQASLSGSVSFFAVPAEEYIDADKRARLRKEGIGFPASGKSELIRLGEFDHSDIILTTHVHMMPERQKKIRTQTERLEPPHWSVPMLRRSWLQSVRGVRMHVLSH